VGGRVQEAEPQPPDQRAMPARQSLVIQYFCIAQNDFENKRSHLKYADMSLNHFGLVRVVYASTKQQFNHT
jgi:hypothetical protein